jgi:hypothetical protein
MKDRNCWDRGHPDRRAGRRPARRLSRLKLAKGIKRYFSFGLILSWEDSGGPLARVCGQDARGPGSRTHFETNVIFRWESGHLA